MSLIIHGNQVRMNWPPEHSGEQKAEPALFGKVLKIKWRTIHCAVAIL
jgi:hypothetical protein